MVNNKIKGIIYGFGVAIFLLVLFVSLFPDLVLFLVPVVQLIVLIIVIVGIIVFAIAMGREYEEIQGFYDDAREEIVETGIKYGTNSEEYKEVKRLYVKECWPKE